MIETTERQSVPLFLAHHHGTAMRAGVQKSMDRAAAIAIEDQLAATDRTRDEIAVVDDFGAVAEVEPAAVENPPPLLLKHRLFGEGAPVDAEVVVAEVVELLVALVGLLLDAEVLELLVVLVGVLLCEEVFELLVVPVGLLVCAVENPARPRINTALNNIFVFIMRAV